MAAKAYSRGWEIIRKDGQWVYVDTGELCWGEDDRRPCKRCGQEPTPEGYDACLGDLGEDVASACCGHGVQEGWVTTKSELGIE